MVTCGNLGELETAVKTQAYEYSHVSSLPAARGIHTAIFAGYGNAYLLFGFYLFHF